MPRPARYTPKPLPCDQVELVRRIARLIESDRSDSQGFVWVSEVSGKCGEFVTRHTVSCAKESKLIEFEKIGSKHPQKIKPTPFGLDTLRGSGG